MLDTRTKYVNLRYYHFISLRPEEHPQEVERPPHGKQPEEGPGDDVADEGSHLAAEEVKSLHIKQNHRWSRVGLYPSRSS